MANRRYQHAVAIKLQEAGKVITRQEAWNYFREMLQVANVDPANRKSARTVKQAVDDPSIAFQLYHTTYFVHDEDCMEWINWLVKNGFSFTYEYNGDGHIA